MDINYQDNPMSQVTQPLERGDPHGIPWGQVRLSVTAHLSAAVEPPRAKDNNHPRLSRVKEHPIYTFGQKRQAAINLGIGASLFSCDHFV